MPGKRPRQIQRTTSMSQLGGDGGCVTMGARFSRTAPESFYKEAGASFPEDAGALHRRFSPPKQELLDNMELCTGAWETTTLAAFMEDTHDNISIDASVEECLFASHAGQPGALHPTHQASRLRAQYLAHLGADQAAHSSYLIPPAQSKSRASQMGFYRGHDAHGSLQPVHFLDVCFLCSKQLGHGRDVFIYRGDRAYCSVECRHFQIVADERREKCGLTTVKERVGANTPANDVPTSSGQVETAAAA